MLILDHQGRRRSSRLPRKFQEGVRAGRKSEWEETDEPFALQMEKRDLKKGKAGSPPREWEN